MLTNSPPAMRRTSRTAVTATERLNADQVPVGARILARDGFTERFGRAYGLRRTRFATTMRVKFDDYSFDEFTNATPTTKQALRESAGGAIGWYVVKA